MRNEVNPANVLCEYELYTKRANDWQLAGTYRTYQAALDAALEIADLPPVVQIRMFSGRVLWTRP